MTNVLMFIVGCVFTHNIVFDRLLGVCDAGQDRRVEVSIVYGIAVALVMTLASVCAWIVNALILAPLHAEFLQIIAFTLVAILMTLVVQMVLPKVRPAWAELLGDCMLPIAANCAVLGVTMLNAFNGFGFGYALLNGLFSGVGFLLAIVLMAGIQEKLEFAKVPESFKGMPITLISAALIALAFIGFKGMA